MAKIRLGMVDYLNCMPVYYALEEGLLPLDIDLEIIKGTPAFLNSLFLSGELDVTPLSSIEYARNVDYSYIMPDLSISSDGRVGSILFFSKVPATELDGRRVCLTESSATSVVLLKVLFDHYYQVEVKYETMPPDLFEMMDEADGALLIGDDALIAYRQVKKLKLPYHVADLGGAWKQLTSEKMVFAVWAVRKAFADENPEKVEMLRRLLLESKDTGFNMLPEIISKARKKTGLTQTVLKDYFATVKYDFDQSYRKSLLTFYDYAYKSGLIEDRVRLKVWGEKAD